MEEEKQAKLFVQSLIGLSFKDDLYTVLHDGSVIGQIADSLLHGKVRNPLWRT